jgi:hypothetical protein
VAALRINRARLVIETEKGPFGVDIAFETGLNIIRASNTSGKSTCFNAIIYGLGLDGLITFRKKDLPLQKSLTAKIEDPTTDAHVSVRSSKVELEIGDASGRRTSLERFLYGGESNQLIRVYDHCDLDESKDRLPQDMFTRRSGAAQLPHGFEHWLAEDFLKWHLPEVERTDGGTSQLYLDTIFPLFFVEQRFGWTRIQGNMPYVYRIKDVNKRATEFVLNLSLTQSEFERGELERAQKEQRAKYAASVATMTALSEITNCILEDVPMALPDTPITPRIRVNTTSGWYDLDKRLPQIETRAKAVDEELSALTLDVVQRTAALLDKRRQLDESVADVGAKARSEAQEIASLKKHLAALDENLETLKDLQALHAVSGNANIIAANCPTCWQGLPDNVVPDSRSALSLPSTIALVNAERALVRSSIRESATRKAALDAERSRLTEDLERANATLDVAQDNAGDAPRVALMAEALSLRQERTTLSRLAEKIRSYVNDANAAIVEARKLKTALDMLPTKLSNMDKAKLDTLEESFREQEREYGFSSYAINELSISRENYRPVVESFEIGQDASASDGIRTMWSYLVGLLETSRAFSDEHHIGMLMFDEPRQQGTNPLSFGQLLRHVSVSRQYNEQVIFFTSEAAEDIERQLAGTRYNLREFEGRMLRPL